MFNIVDAKTYNDSKKLYKKLVSKIKEIPIQFRKFIMKKFIINFKRCINHLNDKNISKTSNQIENYFRNTLPKSIKRIYKTKKGLKDQITVQKQKWEINQKIKNTN